MRMMQRAIDDLQPAPALSLKVLGAPEVRYNGQPVKFRSRKELALLIYLVIVRGRHSRETLMALLWPDSDRKLSQAALRNTLVRTRQALGEAADYLRVEQTVVSFDADRYYELDLNILETALRTIAESPARADPADISRLDAAVGEYRGDFLTGFSLADAPDFDDWASQQREAWHQRLERIFNRLSRLQFERGQIDQAIDTTQRWIAHSSLNEAAYRRLMQLHFLAGNRTAALQVYSHCEAVLAQELVVQPDAETLALAQQMRTDALPSPIPTVEESHPLFHELPFVGRAAEHSQLVALHQAATRGTPQVVCVMGEAGVGKTRLLQTFLAWASIQQADILSGRALEAGGQLPYQPLVAALRPRLARETAPADLLADVWLAGLSQLLPELRERYPDLPPPSSADPTIARSHLFEALAQLGQALSQRRLVVLCLDDLQWADAATLEVVPYLCRLWTEGRARVLLLIASRSEMSTTGPRVGEWLAQLEREVSVSRLRLLSLTAEATRQLVHALAGPAAEQQIASHHFSDWLFDETAGQPYFIAETVKMLVERDVLQASSHPDGRWTIDFGAAVHDFTSRGQLPTPASVRGVILARLGRLSDTGGALLVAGAILGRACSYEQLCRVSGTSTSPSVDTGEPCQVARSSASN
jgi:DNA-binding SARP family transcriptional activator